MRGESFALGEYYHVYNRGVDRVQIFHTSIDFQRFYNSLYLFNDANYEHHGGSPYLKENLLASHEVLADERQPFVKIFAFCILSNHFHLFMQQAIDDGIPAFMMKLCGGYSRYHNLRYDRSGPLFDGRYKAIRIDNEAYFQHVPRYIHLNALDTVSLPWRDGEVIDWPLAARKLDAYPWSSHRIYKGEEQELPVVDPEMARRLFTSSKEYEEFLFSWSGRYVFNPDNP